MRAETLAKAMSAIRTSAAAIILIGLISGVSQADKAITGINVANKADRIVITVRGNCALNYSPLLSTSGRYLGFQFPCKLVAKGRLIGIRSGRIYNVRYSNFRAWPPTSRIVINSARHLDYSTEWSADKKQVQISVMKVGVGSRLSAVGYRAAGNSRREGEAPAEPKTSQNVLVASLVTPTEPVAVATPVASAPVSTELKAPEPEVRVLGMTEIKEAPKNEPAAAEPEINEPEPAKTIAAPVDSATTNKYAKFLDKPVMVAMAPVDVSTKPYVDRDKKVSLNFLGADINDVLKALSVQSGKNIVSGKDVTGNVTVTLSNVSLTDALDYITQPNGYTYTDRNGTYIVAKDDGKNGFGTISQSLIGSGPAEETATEPVLISYANPEIVIEALKKDYLDVEAIKVGEPSKSESSKSGEKNASSRGGMILLHGPSSRVLQAVQKAKRLDSAVGHVWAELKTETYKIKYINPAQLAKVIRTMTPGVSVSYAPSEAFNATAPTDIKIDPEGGANVNTATEQNGSSAGTGEAKGAPLIDPVTGMSYSASVTKEDEANCKVLLFTGQANDVQKAIDLATLLDTKSPQIKIEAKITSINEYGGKKLGVNWDWGNYSVIEGSTSKTANKSNSNTVSNTNDNESISSSYGGSATGTKNANSQDVGTASSTINDKTSGVINGITDAVSTATSAIVGSGQFFRQPWKFSAVLEAMVTNGQAQVLASPNLICLEGKPGAFFVGDEVTYIQRIETTATGQNITTDTKQVGVQLRAAGSVSPDGYITLDLHPEVSTLKLSVEQGVTLPVVSRRFTDHIIRVKSGDTIVIGGLIRNDEIDEMSKVPLLGDLPFLGQLFRHKGKTRDHTEVVMFITATVLKD